MKKVLFAMAVAAMFGFVACNNNKAAEETVDSMAVETVATECEATAQENDTNLVEEVAAENAEAVVEDLTK